MAGWAYTQAISSCSSKSHHNTQTLHSKAAQRMPRAPYLVDGGLGAHAGRLQLLLKVPQREEVHPALRRPYHRHPPLSCTPDADVSRRTSCNVKGNTQLSLAPCMLALPKDNPDIVAILLNFVVLLQALLVLKILLSMVSSSFVPQHLRIARTAP